MEVVEGRDATLSCIVLHGNPTPKIVWYKTGEPLNLDGKKIISNSLGSLQIKKVSRTDVGDYMCVAHNVGGNTTHVIKLDIQGSLVHIDNAISLIFKIQSKINYY